MNERYFVFYWPDGSNQEGHGINPIDAFERLDHHLLDMISPQVFT